MRAEKNQRENKIKYPPEPPIRQQKSPPKAVTDQAATDPNLPVPIPDEEESATGTSPGVAVDLPAKEEAASEAATGTAPDQVESHITATFKIPYPNTITLEGWD